MISDWQRSLALRLLRTGATCSAVADEVGIAPAAASKLARLYGLPVRPRGTQKGATFPDRRKPVEIRDRAIALMKDGLSLRAIGKELGVSHETVNQWTKQAGVENWHSKHAWSLRKRRGKDMIRKGATDEDVADRLGVHVATAKGWRKAAALDQGDGFVHADKPADVTDKDANLHLFRSHSTVKPKPGRPRKNPPPITLATDPPPPATFTQDVTPKTEAQSDLEWLRDDMERRRERARIERERLFG